MIRSCSTASANGFSRRGRSRRQTNARHSLGAGPWPAHPDRRRDSAGSEPDSTPHGRPSNRDDLCSGSCPIIVNSPCSIRLSPTPGSLRSRCSAPTSHRNCGGRPGCVGFSATRRSPSAHARRPSHPSPTSGSSSARMMRTSTSSISTPLTRTLGRSACCDRRSRTPNCSSSPRTAAPKCNVSSKSGGWPTSHLSDRPGGMPPRSSSSPTKSGTPSPGSASPAGPGRSCARHCARVPATGECPVPCSCRCRGPATIRSSPAPGARKSPAARNAKRR